MLGLFTDSVPVLNLEACLPRIRNEGLVLPLGFRGARQRLGVAKEKAVVAAAAAAARIAEVAAATRWARKGSFPRGFR